LSSSRDVEADTDVETESEAPPDRTWGFARYLVAYRGNLTRQEAARRCGLPEVLWERIELIQPSEPVPDLVPAAIVAAMCAGVRADVATGLRLAGHRPDSYPYLIERPPIFSSLTRGTDSIPGPYIATPHVINAALAGGSVPARSQIAAIYRQLAESNQQIADQIGEDPPDSRSEYWSGYVAAIRTVAEQQAWAAEQEATRPSRD
jgi:hypothetical protein